MPERSLPARLALPAVLVLAVFALYAQTARHEFVGIDTNLYIVNNARVLTGLSWSNVAWAFTKIHAANWHPLTWISHMLDVELFGLRPAGHQLENAGWHAANTLLVFALFQRLGMRRAFAFAGALLFAVHPLRAESVAWIVERKDLLSCFFGLASLLVWLAHVRARSEGVTNCPGTVRHGWAKLAGALVLFACSLMSKAMFVTLPCLLVLLEFWPLGRGDWRPVRRDLDKLPFFALSIVACFVTVRAQSALGAVQGLGDFPLAGRVQNALCSYVWYLQKSFWPTELAFHYPLESGGAGVARTLFAGVLLAVITGFALYARRRAPWLLVGWLWFLGALVPVIGLLQVGGQAHADRFTYFPGLGLVLALVFTAQELWLPRVGARTLAFGAAAIVLALGAASWRQIATWHDTQRLSRHALSVTQANNVALDLLGITLVEAGDVDAGLPLLREAVRLAPTDPDALTNLGGTLLRKQEYAEAESVLKKVAHLAPWRAQPLSFLGGMYHLQHKDEEALGVLDEAVRLEPDHLGAWTNRGIVLEALGRFDDARASYATAIALRHDAWNTRLSLARLCLRLERTDEARAQFAAVLAGEPANFEALRGMERVALARRDWKEAWGYAERAARVRPDAPPVLADQAWILASAESGELAQPANALKLAERALTLGGEQPALLDALALAAAANGDFVRAAATAQKALDLLARGGEPQGTERLARRLAAYQSGRIDRETPR